MDTDPTHPDWPDTAATRRPVRVGDTFWCGDTMYRVTELTPTSMTIAAVDDRPGPEEPFPTMSGHPVRAADGVWIDSGAAAGGSQ